MLVGVGECWLADVDVEVDVWRKERVQIKKQI